MMAETNVLAGWKTPKGVITTPFGWRAIGVKGYFHITQKNETYTKYMLLRKY